MLKSNIKKFFVILGIVIVLLLLTYINQKYIKNSAMFSDSLYNNDLAIKIDNNDLANINYNFINEDLNNIDEILKEQVNLELDRVKKASYYGIAEKIYSNKINEIIRVLNDKLDDEDFYRLESDMDEFQKNIDFAIIDLDNTIESSLEFEFYKNKYLYEEKQKKCRDILETYKGFLK